MENEMGPGSICGPVVYKDSGFLRSEAYFGSCGDSLI